MNVQGFTNSQTVSIAASGTSGAATFLFPNRHTCIVSNGGSVMAFIRFTTGASIASTSDFPVQPNLTYELCKGPTDTVSAITGAGSTTLYFSTGEGQ